MINKFLIEFQILLLSRIEAEYRDDRLFETLIRSKKLEDDN